MQLLMKRVWFRQHFQLEFYFLQLENRTETNVYANNSRTEKQSLTKELLV